MSKKEKWDGVTRPSNDLYRKRFDEIFKKEKTTYMRITYEKVMRKKREC